MLSFAAHIEDWTRSKKKRNMLWTKQISSMEYRQDFKIWDPDTHSQHFTRNSFGIWYVTTNGFAFLLRSANNNSIQISLSQKVLCLFWNKFQLYAEKMILHMHAYHTRIGQNTNQQPSRKTTPPSLDKTNALPAKPHSRPLPEDVTVAYQERRWTYPLLSVLHYAKVAGSNSGLCWYDMHVSSISFSLDAAVTWFKKMYITRAVQKSLQIIMFSYTFCGVRNHTSRYKYHLFLKSQYHFK